MFCITGERLEKRSTELASLSNEISSLVDSQTLLIQDLEKMSSDQVMWFFCENICIVSLTLHCTSRIRLC